MALVLNGEAMSSSWYIVHNPITNTWSTHPSEVNGLEIPYRGDSPYSSNNASENSSDISINYKREDKINEEDFISIPSYYTNYSFELPSYLVGKLIGKNGKVIKWLKKSTHSDIYVVPHPYKDDYNVIVIDGLNDEIKSALSKIRDIFPQSNFSDITLLNLDQEIQTYTFQLYYNPLPNNCFFNVHISAIISAGHIFVQHKENLYFPDFLTMQEDMNIFYEHIFDQNNSSQFDTFMILQPQINTIYAGKIGTNWYRCQIIENFESSFYKVKLIDFGSTANIQTNDIKKLEYQFCKLPVMATECYLSNIIPLEDEDVFSLDANSTIETLANVEKLEVDLFNTITSQPSTNIFNGLDDISFVHPTDLLEENVSEEALNQELKYLPPNLNLYARIDRYSFNDGFPFVTLFYHQNYTANFGDFVHNLHLSNLIPSLTLPSTIAPLDVENNYLSDATVCQNPEENNQHTSSDPLMENMFMPFKEEDLVSINQMMADLKMVKWTEDLFY